MRGIFQYHQNITYIFIGSQESMIREIFQNKKNPFYKFGRHISLHKIPDAEFSDFVTKRFSSQKTERKVIIGIASGNYNPTSQEFIRMSCPTKF